jgi:O-antigen ligase
MVQALTAQIFGRGPLRTRVSFCILIAVTVLAPLPFGSAEEHWIVIWAVVLALGIIVLSTQDLRPPHTRIIAAVLGVAAALILLVALQSASFPEIVPTHPIWTEAGPLLGLPAPKMLPASSAGTPWYSLGPALLLIQAFLAAYILSIDPARADTLLKAVALSGLVYAGYALLSSLVAQPIAPGLVEPFVNRNTAATYYGSCAVLWLAILLPGLAAGVSTQQRIRFARMPSLQLFGAGAAFLVMVIAVFLTTSRAGIALTFLALALTGTMILRRLFRKGLPFVLGVSVLLIGVAALLQQFGSRVALRIPGSGALDESRWILYEASVSAILDHPWIGTGLGTFAEVFPAYRPPDLPSRLIWEKAHSSLLELAVETGVPFTLLCVSLWLYGLFHLVRGCQNRRRGVRFPAAGLGVLVLGAGHSMADFSLQVPGYAIVFAAVLGCGLAQSKRPVSAPLRLPDTHAPGDRRKAPPNPVRTA